MPSAAEQQAEALADVERIASRLFALLMPTTHHLEWSEISEELRERHRQIVTELLHTDTIRVGHRPPVDRPMTGQTNLYDQLSGAEMLHGEALRGGGRTHDAREALADLYRPRDRRDG